MNALEGFTTWLPGELIYAATKQGGGYDTRVNRARRGSGDRSMYSFLGNEWHHAQLALGEGMHYAPSHQKTAQLQLAKFAAGFFDKVGVTLWINDGLPATEDAFSECAQRAAEIVLDVRPWESHSIGGFDPASELEKPFAQTCFSDDLLTLQESFVSLVDGPRADEPNERTLQQNRPFVQALLLGGRATLCYLEYASQHLTLEQYEIPRSEHAV